MPLGTAPSGIENETPDDSKFSQLPFAVTACDKLVSVFPIISAKMLGPNGKLGSLTESVATSYVESAEIYIFD